MLLAPTPRHVDWSYCFTPFHSFPGSCYVYSYTNDLERLLSPHPYPASQIYGLPPPALSPLNLPAWEAALVAHPDKRYTQLLSQGLRHGFRVGFTRPHGSLQPCKRNIPSAYDHPEVVSRYLQEECLQGRVLGPFPTGPPGLHISRFGVIPKRSQPGKWRLIVDLSAPKDHSVNDGIADNLCSLKYPSIDTAIELVLSLGPGAYLSKLDIKEAYRMVPVHPEDWPLLGMRWQGAYYVDTRLPFGLRSAPKIFNAVADALHWIMTHKGIQNMIHYLDDFLMIEPPASKGHALSTALTIWESLGAPVAPNKAEGPATCLCFLGIELDTVHLTARLPSDKLERLQSLLRTWGDKKACTKRELLSLIGVLQHASAVVRYGRCFLCRMIDLSTTAAELHHHLRLNREFRSDLQWWSMFCPRWNGVCALTPIRLATPDIVVHSDASGSWGFGAIWDSHWIQGQWPNTWSSVNITAKELLPIVLSAGLWGRSWKLKCVHFRCDNEAIVHAISAWRSKEPLVMHLLRGLALLAMEFSFQFKASHIAGSLNVAADAISRNDLPSFFVQVPQASNLPDLIPRPLLDIFLHQQPDWLSTSWKESFANFCRLELPNPQRDLMPPVSEGICNFANKRDSPPTPPPNTN